MGGLKRLSGNDLIKIFEAAGFVLQSQKGSHVKLRRATGGGAQTLTIPRHPEMDTGTLRAIMRQASRFLPDEWLRSRFYND